MNTISTQQVNTLRERDPSIPVINVLDPQHFEQEHIPGSENIPLNREDFTAEVEQTVGQKDRPVVLYCASPECDASPKAAQQLEARGFTNVYDYEGGMKAWRDAGLPVESAR